MTVIVVRDADVACRTPYVCFKTVLYTMRIRDAFSQPSPHAQVLGKEKKQN